VYQNVQLAKQVWLACVVLAPLDEDLNKMMQEKIGHI
jgi:hypothetical protein